ncbi:hypothetical protein AJ87_31915 [Rhizobium yanglingense]|nr:hypothetical protein AJ87_31915 [Rhizobium yanglingense]
MLDINLRGFCMSKHSLAFKLSVVEFYEKGERGARKVGRHFGAASMPTSTGRLQFVDEHTHTVWSDYIFRQLTGDSGAGATLGDFKSRVFGIGPQIGYKFEANDTTDGYVNLKGYCEFGAENRG